MWALFVAAVSVAFMHSFAPDHWVPLVAIARGAKWSQRQLAVVAAIAGILHVVVSVGIALLAVWGGVALAELAGINAMRGDWGTWLLISFGAIYALWGIWHAGKHKEAGEKQAKDAIKDYAIRRVIILMLIMVVHPAEPIMPLLWKAQSIDVTAMWFVGLGYSVTLALMIVVQSCLAYGGVNLLKVSWMERHVHSLAGLAIMLTGVLLIFMEH